MLGQLRLSFSGDYLQLEVAQLADSGDEKALIAGVTSRSRSDGTDTVDLLSQRLLAHLGDGLGGSLDRLWIQLTRLGLLLPKLRDDPRGFDDRWTSTVSTNGDGKLDAVAADVNGGKTFCLANPCDV